MAGLPEKIACPTCGAENAPSAKTCRECGADLTVVVGVISTATRHYNSALRLAEEGMVDHAVIEAEAAVELWERNAHFHNLLGTLYAKKGLLDKAVAEWKKTLSLDPTMAKASESIEKARKLELLQADRANKRPYYIAVGVLAVLALLFLAWGGFTQQKMNRLSGRLAVLEQDSDDLEALRRVHAETAAELESAWAIVEASGAVETGLRGKVEEQEAELSRAADQLRTSEQQVAGQSAELDSLKKRLAELERRLATPPVITAADLRALRDENAQLKAKVTELETAAAERDEELITSRNRVEELGMQVRQQSENLETTQQELSKNAAALARAEAQNASLEERLAAVKSELRRWDLRNTEIAQILRLAQDRRYAEASLRLEEVRWAHGSNPLVDTLAAGVQEELRVANDPFERELRWWFEQQRRENEPRWREDFADEHFASAQKMFREGMYHKALGELEAVEKIHPGHRGVEELRQRILGEQAKSETMVVDLIDEADAAMAAGDNEKALRLLQQALEQFPDHPVAVARLEEVEQNLKQSEQSAEQEYRRDVADVEALVKEGKLAESLRFLDVLDRKYPDDARLARLRAITESRIQDRLERIPQDLERGDELFIDGNYSKVVQLMNDVLQWQPDNQHAVMLRDEAAMRLDLLQMAFAAAEDLYREGRFEEARSRVEEILQAQPDHSGAKRLKSDIATALKKQ